jgi:hypothetical protein
MTWDQWLAIVIVLIHYVTTETIGRRGSSSKELKVVHLF